MRGGSALRLSWLPRQGSAARAVGQDGFSSRASVTDVMLTQR